MSWGAAIFGLSGLVFVLIGLAAIGSPLFKLKTNPEKFPKPSFGETTRAEALTNLCFGIAFSLAILEQGMFAWEHRGVITIELAKQLTLVAVLYVLLLVTAWRKIRSDSIAWTYDRETELLLGTVSAEVAARRIEDRALGPRLQDVMDRFFEDMDSRFNEIDSLFDQCRSKLESVREVPPEYGAERASRIREATLALSAHIDALTSECNEFGSYLIELETESIGSRKAILAPHIARLKARHETYTERLGNAKAERKKLVG